MNSKFSKFVGLSESQFNRLKTELDLDDKLMQEIISNKIFTGPGALLKATLYALIRRDVKGNVDFTNYLFNALRSDNLSYLEAVKSKYGQLATLLYNKYKPYFENDKFI